MEGMRARIAAILEQNLEHILDRVMLAYEAEIPRVKTLDANARAGVREAVRRTVSSFLGVYARPDAPADERVQQARRVTVEQEGVLFSRAEILTMITVARHVVYQVGGDLVRARLGRDAALEADITEALEAFMDELERPERDLAAPESAVDRFLQVAETEDPDLA